MSDNARAQRYYDDFASRYEDGRDGGYHALIDQLELQVVQPYLDGRRVLEVGCGTGLLLDPISARAREAVGVDLSANMLKRAQDRELSVLQSSITQLPFKDGSFDTVCSFKVLAHIPEIDRAIREMVRVTRPGGHLVLEFYNALSLRYLVKRLTGPRQIGRSHREDDVFTRWESPWSTMRRFEGLRRVGVFGVRILTPAAVLHRMPGRKVLARLERLSLDSPLRWFGGFLLFVLQRPVGNGGVAVRNRADYTNPRR